MAPIYSLRNYLRSELLLDLLPKYFNFPHKKTKTFDLWTWDLNSISMVDSS